MREGPAASAARLNSAIRGEAEGGWLNRKEAACFLRHLGLPIEHKTLANLAAKENAGRGPPYTKFSWNAVRYMVKDLRAWAERRKQLFP